MTKEAIALGNVIRNVRKARKLTQEALAFESGVNRTYLSQIERGLQNPTIETLFRLTHALKIPAADIIQAVENDVAGTQRGDAPYIQAVPELPQEFVDVLERGVREFLSAGDSEAAIAYTKLKLLEAHLLGIKEGLARKKEGLRGTP